MDCLPFGILLRVYNTIEVELVTLVGYCFYVNTFYLFNIIQLLITFKLSNVMLRLVKTWDVENVPLVFFFLLHDH